MRALIAVACLLALPFPATAQRACADGAPPCRPQALVDRVADLPELAFAPTGNPAWPDPARLPGAIQDFPEPEHPAWVTGAVIGGLAGLAAGAGALAWLYRGTEGDTAWAAAEVMFPLYLGGGTAVGALLGAAVGGAYDAAHGNDDP